MKKIKVFKYKNAIRARKQGLTLIELLVTLVITLSLASILFWMLLTGRFIWQSSIFRSSISQDIQILARRIDEEMRDSQLALVTNDTAGSPVCFSFSSAYNSNGIFVTDNSGKPVWQKYVIFYIPTGTKKLLRKEVYTANSTSPLTISQLNTYCDGKGVLLASSVSSLTLTPNPDGKSAVLSITAEGKNSLGKTERQSHSVTIYIRN